MSGSQRHSPARSQGALTPRRRNPQRTHSVCSPALSNASGRLSSLIQEYRERNERFSVLSPVVRRSMLNDNTEIEEPKRKSWWKNLGEDTPVAFTPEVMEMLEENQVMEANNIIDELDIEVLSQEKKNYTLDLPESSGSESINSIVIPQKRFFTEKENLPQKKYDQFGTRDTLSKLAKSNAGAGEKTVRAATKELFQNKPRSKPVFPSALLDISTDKTTGEIALTAAEPKSKIRNIFGNRQGTKRKNMFANCNFIVSESEDEMPEIQPKIFGFQKTSETVRRPSSTARCIRDSSPTSSNTTDMEIDDWKLLPSSTLVETQLEAMMASGQTPKRARLSKLSEAKESVAGTSNTDTDNKTKQSNKSTLSVNKSICEKDKLETSVSTRSRSQGINSSLNKSNNKNVSQLSIITRSRNRSGVIEENEKNSSNKLQNNSTKINLKNTSAHSAKLIENNDDAVDASYQKERSISYVQNQNVLDPEEEHAVNMPKEREQCEQNSDEMNFTLEYINDEIDSPKESSVQNNNIESHKKTNKSVVNNLGYEQPENNAITNEKSVDQQTKNEESIIQNKSINKAEEIKPNIQDKNNKNQLNKTSRQNETIKEDKFEQSERLAVEHDNKKINQNQKPNCSQEMECDNNRLNQANKSEEVQNINKFVQGECQETQNECQEELNGSLHANNESQKEINKSQEVENESEELNKSEEIQNESQEEQNENEVAQNESQEVLNESEEGQNESEEEQNESQDVLNESVEEQNESEEEQNESQEVQNESVEEQIESEEEQNESQEKINESQDVDNESNKQQMESEEEQDEKNESCLDSQEIQNESEIEKESEDENDQEMECDASNESEIEDVEEEEAAENDQDDNQEHESDQEDISENEDEINQKGNTEDISTTTPNVSHDTTGRNRKKDESPEAILHDTIDQAESFAVRGQNTSIRKTKSMIKTLNMRPSSEPIRESLILSDGTKNSSAEGSGWDSHRTTRKTLRQTFGKDFTPRKSLRALVMEKSAKRQTVANDAASMTAKFPLANSTELPEQSTRDDYDEMIDEPQVSDHEVSRQTRQATLEMYLQKIQKENMEVRLKIEEEVRTSLKHPPRDTFNLFKVPARPMFPRRSATKAAVPKPKPKVKSFITLEDLPEEVIEDMKYKPSKRFQPTDAPWITKRLYKYLESKLELKYDYKARVRAEKLVETIYNFAKDMRRRELASTDAVEVLKHEMARLDVVKTHFEFYEFFHEFMPRAVRVKVIPTVVNDLPLPREGVFADILRGNK